MIKSTVELPANYLCSIESEFRILINAANQYSGISNMDGTIISEFEEFLERLRRDKRNFQRMINDLKGRCANSHKEGKCKIDQMTQIEEILESIEDMESELTGILEADL